MAPLPTPFLLPTLPPRPVVPIYTPGIRTGTITTSLGQRVNVTVSGFDDSPMRFGQLVLAINEIERLLEVPYPSPSVTMRRVAAVPDGFCGYNQLSYSPRYVGDPYVIDDSVISVRVDHRCDETFATIAHETAHTWFHGSDERADWIDEGLPMPWKGRFWPPSHLMRLCTRLSPTATVTGTSGSWSRPIRAKVSGDQYTGFECNYTLGDGIFGDLSGHYGGDAFNRRIADLAKKRVNETAGDYTIGDVRRALGSGAASRAIINTWYEGNPEMRRYRHLDTVEWTFPPTIDGQYLHFVGKTNEPDMIHEPAAGEDSYCSAVQLVSGRRRTELGGEHRRPAGCRVEIPASP